MSPPSARAGESGWPSSALNRVDLPTLFGPAIATSTNGCSAERRGKRSRRIRSSSRCRSASASPSASAPEGGSAASARSSRGGRRVSSVTEKVLTPRPGASRVSSERSFGRTSSPHRTGPCHHRRVTALRQPSRPVRWSSDGDGRALRAPPRARAVRVPLDGRVRSPRADSPSPCRRSSATPRWLRRQHYRACARRRLASSTARSPWESRNRRSRARCPDASARPRVDHLQHLREVRERVGRRLGDALAGFDHSRRVALGDRLRGDDVEPLAVLGGDVGAVLGPAVDRADRARDRDVLLQRVADDEGPSGATP